MEYVPCINVDLCKAVSGCLLLRRPCVFYARITYHRVGGGGRGQCFSGVVLCFGAKSPYTTLISHVLHSTPYRYAWLCDTSGQG